MTTYTISGFRSTFDGETLTGFSESVLTLVVIDSLYNLRNLNEPNANAGSLSEGNPRSIDDLPYNVLFDGVQESSIFDTGIGGSYFGVIDWGAGNSSFVLSFYDGLGSEFFFQVGGDPMPNLDSLAEIEAFNATITDSIAITPSAYTQGIPIDLTGLTNISVSQNDVIRGDGGTNSYLAGLGRDKVFGLGGDDYLYGGEGADRLFGGTGNDKVVGGGGWDKLFGGVGRDVLLGNQGNDTLFGGVHADRLNGGFGDDYLTGGLGRDVFVFGRHANLGSDTIEDFKNGIDKISIGGTTVFADLTITADGVNTIVSWLNTEVTLLDTDAATINAADFIF